MNEYRDFIRAIKASPKDQLLKLIFADWLDEHDRGEDAAAIRSRRGVRPVILHEPTITGVWDAGLVVSVTLTHEQFLRCAGVISVDNPVLEWIIRDVEPDEYMDGTYMWWVDGAGFRSYDESRLGLPIFEELRSMYPHRPRYRNGLEYNNKEEAVSHLRAACFSLANKMAEMYC